MTETIDTDQDAVQPESPILDDSAGTDDAPPDVAPVDQARDGTPSSVAPEEDACDANGADGEDASLAGANDEGLPAGEDVEVADDDDDSPVVEEAGACVVSDDGTEYGVGSVIEAILLATDAPISARKIAQIIEGIDGTAVRQHIKALNQRYAESGSSFRIEAVAKGFQIYTIPVFNPWVSKLQKARAQARLSPAALETLAIVAYKQPILRADIEAVRGVSAGDMLVRLREANLVRIAGRAEEIGRPLLYGTTSKFLEVFGLSSLKDLPKLDPQSDGRLPPLKVANPEPADDSDEAADEPADVPPAPADAQADGPDEPVPDDKSDAQANG